MIEVKIINSKKVWENFVLNYQGANFLQSWNWGKFNQTIGHQIFRLGFFKSNKLEGVSLIIKKNAKRGTYLECPAGPLFHWEQSQYFQVFTKKVKKLAKQEDCLFVRVRPQLKNALTNKIIFKNNGYIPAPMHLHAETTWQLGLDKAEEGLLRDMRKTTRYLIRKAKKDGVKISQSVKIKDLDILYKLQMEAVARHKFVPFTKKYFLKEFKAFISDNQIRLFKASYKNRILAAALIIFYAKEAIYHYSGSSSAFPKIPASHLLQWEAIKQAKKCNCHIYNFWGISPTDNPKHRFAGVTLFKKGFGGYKLDYLPAHDLPINNFYWLVYFFEKIRKLHRRL